jgi:hypothetical protein
MADKKTPGDRSAQRAKAAEVVKSAEIQSVRVVQAACRTMLMGDAPLAHLHNHVDVKVSGDAETRQCTVTFDCSLRGSHEPIALDIPVQTLPFFIGATFRIVYALNVETLPPSELLTAFALRTGIYNVWPYWREFVQSMTTRMGLPALTIPLVRTDVTTGHSASVKRKRRRKG